MAKRIAMADRKICVACGVCMKVCPKDAIQIHKGCYALIRSEMCVGCGRCADNCPAGCIKVKEREDV